MRYLRSLSLLLVLALLTVMMPVMASADETYEYYINIDLTNQIVTVYRTSDDVIVRQMLCSAGKNGATVTGTYPLAKAENEYDRKEWYHFKGFGVYAKYPTRIFKGILFHSLTYNHATEEGISAKAIEEYGSEASHGCVRLLVEDAKWIQEHCPVGLPCHIFYSGVRDETLRSKLYQEHYTIDSGMTYAEYWGLSGDDNLVWQYSSQEDIQLLQRRLHELGYYNGEYDGTFGDETISAIILAQRDAGVDVTGTVSGDFFTQIYSEDAPACIGHDLSSGDHGPTVRLLQNNLAALGLYTGEIDGIYDQEVADAVIKFQNFYGYDQDGIATVKIQYCIENEIQKAEEACGEDFTAEVVTETIEQAVVQADDVKKIRMREKASTSSDEVCKVKVGGRVTIVERGTEWTQVQYSKYTGYIKNKYLVDDNEYVYHLECSGDDGTYTIGLTMEQLNNGGTQPAKAFDSEYDSLKKTQDSADSAYVKEALSTINSAEVEEQDKTVQQPDSVSVGATVNTGSEDVRLNLRANPDTSAEILDELADGTEVTVTLANGDWSFIEYNGVQGYVLSDYITTAAGTESAGKADSIYTTEGFAYVYCRPDKSSPKIGYIIVGKDLMAYSSENDFTYVRYGTDFAEEGWVKTELLASVAGVNMDDAAVEELTDDDTADTVTYAHIIDDIKSAKMYKEMDEDSGMLKRIAKGTKVTVLEANEESEWVKVKYDGKTGYVKDSELRFDIENG